MITLKEDGTLESITFYENGWYDCCSGCWFISYRLLDTKGETLFSYNNISECYFIALKVAEHLSGDSPNYILGSVCRDNYYSELELLNLFDDSTVVEVLGRELEYYGVDIVIKPDESIDLSYSITCHD